MKSDCESGGETFHSVGSEVAYGNAIVGGVRQLLGCSSVWVFHPPPLSPAARAKYLRVVGDTPNHRLMWRVWYYQWAMAAGTVVHQDEARDALADFFDREFTTEGLDWAEAMTTSHGQLYLLAVAGARITARHYVKLGSLAEKRILYQTGRRFRMMLWLYDLQQRDGHVFTPCSRGTNSNYELRDVFRALLRGEPAPERLKPRHSEDAGPNDVDGPWWDDAYNVGAWMVRHLIRTGDDLGGAAGVVLPDGTRGERLTEEAVLCDQLHVYSRGPDFLHLVPFFRKASNALYWVARVAGVLIQSPYHQGQIRNLANPYPLPAAVQTLVEDPRTSLTIVPGVTGRIEQGERDGIEDEETGAAHAPPRRRRGRVSQP
jgi:hypothetical protein